MIRSLTLRPRLPAIALSSAPDFEEEQHVATVWRKEFATRDALHPPVQHPLRLDV